LGVEDPGHKWNVLLIYLSVAQFDMLSRVVPASGVRIGMERVACEAMALRGRMTLASYVAAVRGSSHRVVFGFTQVGQQGWSAGGPRPLRPSVPVRETADGANRPS